MKTVHIIGSKTLGGAERFFLRLVSALATHGLEVTAIVRKGSEVAKAVRDVVPAVELPLRTVWDPLSRMEISREIKRIRPEVVQTYMGRATRLTRLERGRGPVHIARLGGYYKLAGYRHAHAWIVNTRGLGDYLIENGFPADRIHLIGNFIHIPRPKPKDEIDSIRPSLGIPEDAVVLMTAGRFIEVKGHAGLLEAFSLIPQRIEGRRPWLLILGDGPLGPSLKAQARALGIDDRTVWAGWQTEPEPFFHAADLVVFPSHEQETFGNVILEAWAAGKPLVTTCFRGAREITRHGEDAWQVPCRDPKALARGIVKVLEDPTLAARIANRGSEKVREEFSREAIVRQYVKLYERLMSAPGEKDL
ncbi:MAG: glycosyltransferase [Deltaproteobacteria bacterium]